MNEILIKGKKVPMRITMGAMLDFKKETGLDVSQLGNDMEQLIIFMFCCVRSACRADSVDFTIGLEEFADSVNLADFNAFSSDMSKDADPGAKKKGMK